MSISLTAWFSVSATKALPPRGDAHRPWGELKEHVPKSPSWNPAAPDPEPATASTSPVDSEATTILWFPLSDTNSLPPAQDTLPGYLSPVTAAVFDPGSVLRGMGALPDTSISSLKTSMATSTRRERASPWPSPTKAARGLGLKEEEKLRLPFDIATIYNSFPQAHGAIGGFFFATVDTLLLLLQSSECCCNICSNSSSSNNNNINRSNSSNKNNNINRSNSSSKNNNSSRSNSSSKNNNSNSSNSSSKNNSNGSSKNHNSSNSSS